MSGSEEPARENVAGDPKFRWGIYAAVGTPISIILAGTAPRILLFLVCWLPLVWTIRSIWPSPTRTSAWDRFWRTKNGWWLKIGASLVGVIAYFPILEIMTPYSPPPTTAEQPRPNCIAIDDAVRAANNSPYFQTNHIRVIEVGGANEFGGACELSLITNGGRKVFHYRVEQINGRSYVSGTVSP